MNKIETILELRNYLGKYYSICYRSQNAKFANVNGVDIKLPITKQELDKKLRKEAS